MQCRDSDVWPLWKKEREGGGGGIVGELQCRWGGVDDERNFAEHEYNNLDTYSEVCCTIMVSATGVQ